MGLKEFLNISSWDLPTLFKEITVIYIAISKSRIVSKHDYKLFKPSYSKNINRSKLTFDSASNHSCLPRPHLRMHKKFPDYIIIRSQKT